MLGPYIDLCIFESLLQIVVDGLVGNFADQRKIRNPDFLLLGRVEGSLPDIGLGTAICRGAASTRVGGFVPLGPFTDALEPKTCQLPTRSESVCTDCTLTILRASPVW